MNNQVLDLFALNLQYIQYALEYRTPYTTILNVAYEGQEVECLVLCYQGNLSLSLGSDMTTNTWTMNNWISKNKKIWSVLGQILTDEKQLLFAMEQNRLPYNFVFRQSDTRQSVIFVRRYGKNYIFKNSDVFISPNFVRWIQQNISLPIYYSNGYYIQK